MMDQELREYLDNQRQHLDSKFQEIKAEQAAHSRCLRDQAANLKSQKDVILKMNRGLYGEQENDSMGVIKRVGDLEKKTKRLDHHKWYESGGLAALFAVFQALKEYFFKQ